jgi:hypothetical protein
MAWLSPTTLGLINVPGSTCVLSSFTHAAGKGFTIVACVADNYGSANGSVSDNASPHNTYRLAASFFSLNAFLQVFTANCAAVPTTLTYTASGVGAGNGIWLAAFEINAGMGNVDASSTAGRTVAGSNLNITLLPKSSGEFGIGVCWLGAGTIAPTDHWTSIYSSSRFSVSYNTGITTIGATDTWSLAGAPTLPMSALVTSILPSALGSFGAIVG